MTIDTEQWDAMEVMIVYGVLMLSAGEILFAFYRYLSVRETALSLQVISTQSIFKPYLRFAAFYVVLYAFQIHVYYYLFVPIVMGVAVALVFCSLKASNTLIEKLTRMQTLMNNAHCHNAQEDVVKTLVWQKKSTLLSCFFSIVYVALFLIAYDIEIVFWLPPLWCIINVSYTLNFVRNRVCIKTQCVRLFCCDLCTRTRVPHPKPRLGLNLRSASDNEHTYNKTPQPIHLEAKEARNTMFTLPTPSSPPDNATPNTQTTQDTPQPMSVPVPDTASPYGGNVQPTLSIAIENVQQQQNSDCKVNEADEIRDDFEEYTFLDAQGKAISLREDDDALPPIPGISNNENTPELSAQPEFMEFDTMRVHPEPSVGSSRSPSPRGEEKMPRGLSTRSETGRTLSIWNYFRGLTTRSELDNKTSNTANAQFDTSHSANVHMGHHQKHLQPHPSPAQKHLHPMHPMRKMSSSRMSQSRDSQPMVKPQIGQGSHSDPVKKKNFNKSEVKGSASKHIVSRSVDVGHDAVHSPADRNHVNIGRKSALHSRQNSRTVTERRLVFDALPTELQQLPESDKKTVEDLARLNKVMSMHGFVKNNALFKFELCEMIEIDEQVNV
eukprot:CAMPEP_0202694190 /NCGR_PEP_ID=MMETSP1385-20130828/8107_1 /ASSEMBLY_ACC=CAM_ASM_000861 /TAXON_ID=933848 /ORGANISM="Elphidium margaritaceum" /LENGTH=608 /DNA_ID=CAMNT_0049349989 /DNA_START=593 /DNA_END=2419 /DNA_ORIENTATION=+